MLQGKNKNHGLTLTELLIALVVIGILSTIAISIYTKHVKRARRSVAIQTLLSMQLAQEHYRSSNSSYGTLAQVWGGVSSTSGGHYTLSISGVSATGYTLTAQAAGTQTSDAENGTACSTLTLTMSSGTELKTPSACWLN